ncbi:hypothetical protein [Azospirillum sp. TSO22-1]|uniref:hypothetical protein n=1 Tax=Azospirillum sp. TSO22-1 TaxID=716789 RepID=UPI000D6168A2|nr:hypothetical protein [Azospirillum sp. TSO22-1]PWC53637.1 hypothetical protein TSO221_10455 [Azospirillum sp. TSO22-1]
MTLGTCYFQDMAEPNRVPDPRLAPQEGNKLDTLRRAIEEGARELEAGLGLDGETVMAKLRAHIEVAYQQVLTGDVVEGDEVFAELSALHGRPSN